MAADDFDAFVEAYRSSIRSMAQGDNSPVMRAGSGETVAMALSVTTIFRREDGRWKVAVRHADRVTTDRRSAE